MKNFFRILGYFLSFAALGVAATFIIFRIVNFEKKGEVPQLVGMSVTEASEELNRRKLLLTMLEKKYDDEIPEGHIISQSVPAGERIRVGTAVDVMVSSGMELYSMPSFEGQNLDEAKLTLGNLDLKVKKVTWVHSDSVENGKIIAQRPLPGNLRTNEINFLVSLGPYDVSYRCPAFVNMRIDDARNLAGKLGIRLKESGAGSKVIFQKPEEGATIQKGSVVEIKLGRGWGMWF